MDRRLISLEVEHFCSLRKITLPLGPLNVLVGPNGSGKTTVLEVFRFLADVIRTDLEPALDLRGGFDEVAFWGGDRAPKHIGIKLKATWTTHSSLRALDEYSLRITRSPRVISRSEAFQFKRTRGRGRRITITGQKVSVVGFDKADAEISKREIGINRLSSGLSTLPRLSDEEGGTEVATVAERLASFRVFDVSVNAARLPARFPRREYEPLDDDAANLAAFLLALRSRDPGAWQQLVDDAVAVVLHDHGLHPQALELLVERLREASERTQFLIATHSPALVDRLKSDELIVCERREDGSSAIPAISQESSAAVRITSVSDAPGGVDESIC